MGTYVTDSAASYMRGVLGTEMERVMLRKGRSWLGHAGLSDKARKSDDIAFLAYLVHKGMSELHHEGNLEDDYLVAGDVLDSYVTDHEAELLVELGELKVDGQVGGMSHEVTAVHTMLLELSGAMRDRWGEVN